jgi:uncharacterized protein (TIGR03067 family)
MKKITGALGLGLIVIVLAVAGCSVSQKPAASAQSPANPEPASPAKSDSVTFQGPWKGLEVGAEAKGSATLIFAGTNVVYRGADTNEWYRGSFTLHEDKHPREIVFLILECPYPDYVGKAVNSIYRIKDGALTVSANEPGSIEIPKTFEDPSARTFIFKADK